MTLALASIYESSSSTSNINQSSACPSVYYDIVKTHVAGEPGCDSIQSIIMFSIRAIQNAVIPAKATDNAL